MMSLKETSGDQSATSLLDGENFGSAGRHSVTDWLGRPADDRRDLGGWRPSLYAVGAYFLMTSALYGIMANFTLYLVEVWGESNSTAASTATNIFGTLLCCSLIGAFVSDSYTGRFWGFVIFAIPLILSIFFISFVNMMLGYGLSSRQPVLETLLFGFSYIMAVATGASSPSIVSLGADQLSLHQEKAQYFMLVAMSFSGGQIFGSTVIAYMDERELWVLGLWLCTAAGGAILLLTPCLAKTCRVNRAGGNPLVRVAQVLVSAARNRKLILPKDPRLLHEVEGESSVIPGCRKLLHTDSLSCVDKAAVKREDGLGADLWRLCTVTQVEEVKCLIRVIPVGLASTSVSVATAQVSSLFLVQAEATNGKLVGELSIAPASMLLFFIAGSLLAGFLQNAIPARLQTKSRSDQAKHAPCTSLQLLGTAMLVGIVTMAVAALVEAHRRNAASVTGSLISASWLVPQNVLSGIAIYVMYSSSMDFFYTEVSDGMRALSLSLALFFMGLGNYLNSTFVLVVSTITTRGGHSGWIADDLNTGHLDYFYWFLACFLTFAFGLFLLYSNFYRYRVIGPHAYSPIGDLS